MMPLFQSIVERGTCFKLLSYMYPIIIGHRENQYCFSGANLRLIYSLKYCLRETVHSNFSLALVKWDVQGCG